MVQKVTVKRVFETGLRHAMNGKLYQPSYKWIPFSNQGRIRQQKERDGFCLLSDVLKIQWDCNLHCPYGY